MHFGNKRSLLLEAQYFEFETSIGLWPGEQLHLVFVMCTIVLDLRMSSLAEHWNTVDTLKSAYFETDLHLPLATVDCGKNQNKKVPLNTKLQLKFRIADDPYLYMISVLSCVRQTAVPNALQSLCNRK